MTAAVAASARVPAARQAAPRPRVQPWACIALAAVLLVAGLALVAASYRLSYQNMDGTLIQLYGADRANRYFSRAVFAMFLTRLRYSGGLLVAAALLIGFFRRAIARTLDCAWGALFWSARHARRKGRSWNWADMSALLAITAIGFCVRLRYLWQPMRYDEAATVLGYASKPAYLGLTIYNEPNNHLFHTLLVHFSMQMAGSSEWAVRLPALIAGTLLCILAYALAQRLATRTAALWTAALVSTSSVLVEYSTNARGYTLMCCATLAVLIAAHQVIRNASALSFGLFGLAAILGVWTIPSFLIPLGGAVVWILWETNGQHSHLRRTARLRLAVTLIASGAAAVAVYTPPIAVNGINAFLRNQWVAPRSLPAFLAGNAAQFQLTWQLWTRDLPLWWAWFLVAGFLAGLSLRPHLRRVFLSLAGWSLFLLAVRQIIPFARNWLFFLPVALLAASVAMDALAQRWIPARVLRIAGPLSAVAMALLLAIPVLRSGSILRSHETGVFPGAAQMEQWMAVNQIPPERVFRGMVSDLPLEYYWWRRTGSRPPNANAIDLRRAGIHDGWMLLNAAYDDSISKIAAREHLQDLQVLKVTALPGASVYRVTWTP